LAHEEFKKGAGKYFLTPSTDRNIIEEVRQNQKEDAKELCYMKSMNIEVKIC